MLAVDKGSLWSTDSLLLFLRPLPALFQLQSSIEVLVLLIEFPVLPLLVSSTAVLAAPLVLPWGVILSETHMHEGSRGRSSLSCRRRVWYL